MRDTIKAGIPETCTAGEIALASSQLFRSNHLRLYHLSGSEQNPSKYLVASRDAPVLIIGLTYDKAQWCGGYEGQPWYISGSPLILPVIWMPQENMKLGQVDDVLSYLEEMLEKDWGDYCGYELRMSAKPWNLYCDFPCDSYCKECPASSETRSRYQSVCDSMPVHEELYDTLAKLHMIRQKADHSWRPTAYGTFLGLIDGYLDAGEGEPCHMLFLLPGCESKLQETMDWVQTHGAQDTASLTLAQRLKLVSLGLPGNAAGVVELVRAFGSMPLADYMAPCPGTVSKLREQFGEMATYQEAAGRLYHFCLESDGSEASNEHCMDLIAELILPIHNEAQANDASHPIPQPVQKLLRKPFPSILLGAAMATGQPCLLWNTEDILNTVLDGDKDRPTSCLTLLQEMLWRADEQKAYTVLFRLLVEPFALMDQATDGMNGPPGNIEGI